MSMKKISLLFVAIVALLNTSWAQTITGQGGVVTRTLNVDRFDEVGLAVVGKVYISKGSTQKVTVEGQANIIDNLETEVEDGEWSIKFDRKAKDYEPLVFHITVPEIKALAVAGSGSIIGEDDFEVDQLDFSIAGSGDIEFSGSARKVSVSIAGNGDVDIEDLKTEDCKVDIAGSGNCKIEVAESLSVSIAGSGDVSYKGSPRISTSIAGSGRVKQM